MNISFNKIKIKTALIKCWSNQSSSKYTQKNPAKGQCGVTALVLNACFGGEILKTPLNGAWHFYNKIDSIAYDLTASQFEKPIEYQNIPSNRDEAFSDTNQEQYEYLFGGFCKQLEDKF